MRSEQSSHDSTPTTGTPAPTLPSAAPGADVHEHGSDDVSPGHSGTGGHVADPHAGHAGHRPHGGPRPQAGHEAHGGHDAHGGHGGHDKHAGHDPEMFRRKFWLSLALTVPLVVTSEMVMDWFRSEER